MAAGAQEVAVGDGVDLVGQAHPGSLESIEREQRLVEPPERGADATGLPRHRQRAPGEHEDREEGER